MGKRGHSEEAILRVLRVAEFGNTALAADFGPRRSTLALRIFAMMFV